ncbi:hypothetical protein JCM3774_005452 [Rhodotorula dairenensis]
MAPAIRLPADRNRMSPLRQSWNRLKQVRGLDDLARWSTRSFRLAQLPLRIRPAMILGTFLALLVLSMLGFHPTLATHIAPPSVPFSDKVLHFVCFAVATALFYACWVVEEPARRVTFWRYWNETVSLVGFTLVGGIGSEFVQALLPYKHFQLEDVLANLLGSGLAVLLMHHYARKARHEAELRRLYVHLDQISPEDDDQDEDEDDSVDDHDERDERGLLRHQEQRREMQESSRRGAASSPGGGGGGKFRMARVESLNGGMPRPASAARRKQALDPWSATEDEIFGLGDDDEEDADHHHHHDDDDDGHTATGPSSSPSPTPFPRSGPL